MANSAMLGLHRIRDALKFSATHVRALLPIVGIDLVGTVLFAVGYWFILQRLVEVLVTLNTLSGELQSAVPGLELPQQFMAHYATMLKLSLMTVALAYALWVACFGYGLYRVYRLVRRSTPLLSTFLFRFAAVSIAALLLLFAIIAGYAQLAAWGMANAIAPLVGSVASIGAALLTIALLFALFLTLQYLNHPLSTIGKLLRTEEWRAQLTAFAVCALFALAAFKLLAWGSQLLWIGIILILALLPLATVLRMLLAHGIRSH